ncbi:MAG: hypothetical protein WCL51_08825 [Bacteroidota bacterium]
MNRTKLLFLLVIAGMLNSFCAMAQKDSTKVGIKFSGFVNSEIFLDTRQTVGGRETLLMLYPAARSYDANKVDLNSHGNFDQLSMMSRLTGTITGPDVLNAKTIGVIEGDFTGTADATNNIFRLRHAYIKLTWKKDELLVGSYWEPIDVPEMIPAVISLNTGAPFHAFSRNPQVRYVHTFDNLKVVAVASSQRDYASDGPLTPGVPNSAYLRNALLPEMHLQLQYNINRHLFGIGGEYKTIQPRLVTTKNIATSEKLSSPAFIAFAKLVFKGVDAKFQGSYGGNLSEHTMMGGYVESSIDTATGNTTYANANTLNLWTDVTTKGHKLNVGLFAGYYKNMGYDKDIAPNGKFYGRGSNIGYLYRIAPRVTYTVGALMFATEFEYTAAQYGTPGHNWNIQDPYVVANFRALIGAFYYF